jgi:PAS domain S-box-containing protein
MAKLFQPDGHIRKTDIIKIILFYLVFGGIWILLSHSILRRITPDDSLYSIITTGIGFSFILVTAGLLYFLINNFSNDRLRQTGLVKIILIYLIVGGVWILFSDSILHSITSDETIYNYISTAIGLIFILFTAGLLYYLINKYSSEIEQAEVNLHESEKRYKGLADSLPQMLFEIDKEGIITFTNQASYKMFGYTEDIFKSDFSIYETIVPEERKQARINMGKIMRDEKQHIEEYTALRNDGTKFPIVFYASPIITNSLTTGLRGIAIDITERKIMENQLIKSKEKAEESEKLKSEFLAQMSHEIRTPLNIILGYTALLKDEFRQYLNEDHKNIFGSVEIAGKRLIRTIDLILNMAELQSCELEITISDTNLYEILNKLTKSFEHSAKEKNIELSCTNTYTEIPVIKSDYMILTEVFQNLIDNAVKFTQSGKIDVNIYKNEKDKYCVAINDSGIGIASEYIDKIFLPFFQEDSGYSRKFEGNGLGLALVKKYLELIKAEITVESIKGKGSSFVIHFN